MHLRGLLLSYFLIQAFVAQAQIRELSFSINSEKTSVGIEGVHVFVANTTFGAVSGVDGEVSFPISNDIEEDLIISHIGYGLQIIEPLEYRRWKSHHKVYIKPNSVEIDEITITASSTKKWKKNYKRFTEAFLGSDKIAKRCKILNPEVLRFDTEGDAMKATASDLIQIENQYLGYSISYQLTHLEIAEDQSIEYLGRAYYEELNGSEVQKIVKENREKIFRNSPKRFFQALIHDRLESEGFLMEEVTYDNGYFNLVQTPRRDDVLVQDSFTNYFLLNFDQFLQVTDLNNKEIKIEKMGVRAGGLESTRFSTAVKEEKANIKFATSQLYKIGPSVILNEWGNVLNTKQLKEYGYWANQRIAHQLPLNYNNDYVQVIKGSSVESYAENNHADLNSNEKLNLLLSLLYEKDRTIQSKNLSTLVENWELGLIGPFLEILRLSSDEWLLDKTKKLLALKYKQSEDLSFYAWLQWMWERDLPSEDYYYEFKAELYKHIDPKFEVYFKSRDSESIVRLDEVVWGGVDQDGIPPLRYPDMITSAEANYLHKNDVVFGMVINGLPRAYPKRILAWHEFFVDDFADTKIAGVYCTLCGTVIAYDMTDAEGQFHNLGTSGFLFRSNKLMYDEATQSLWSTVDGEPVLGPLVNTDIQLNTYPVVSTTWGEWKKVHPNTEVLSLNTGYKRDYTEGEAYKNYFNNDNLMFPVPLSDTRLKNKDEVFVIRTKGYKNDPIAIAVNYLKKKKWYQGNIDGQPFIAIADASGAVRAYEASTLEFKSYKKGKLIDTEGKLWSIHEDYIKSQAGQKLERMSGHNIFWFAWYNVYPETRLIK